MTRDFIEAAKKEKPDLLLTEGTRVRAEDPKANMSEKAVQDEASKIAKGTKNLVFSSFRGNDLDRINTFNEAAQASGRRLVVSMKTAILLDRLAADKRLKVPSLGREVDVYLRRKRSGKLDDKDYYSWERQFLGMGVSADEVRQKQRGVFLHLEAWNFPELVDIKPERGGTYIHAATEAFNEEGEREEEVIRNWVKHVGFRYAQLHASGHAPGKEVAELVNGVAAREVVPIHTEFPEHFKGFQTRARWRLKLPEKGVPLRVGA